MIRLILQVSLRIITVNWPLGNFVFEEMLGFNLLAYNGIAIIVTSDYRWSNEDNLDGTTSDGQRMAEVLDLLNIQVILLPNERAKLANVSGVLGHLSAHLNSIPEDVDVANKVLIFAFAGHGNYYNHYDVKLAADDTHLSLWDEIMPPFVKGHPEHIFKIPKLFFIDACRGNPPLPAASPTGRPGQDTHKDVGNFLIAYSTIKGYISYDDDTWMKGLADKIRDGGHITIILDDLAPGIRPDSQSKMQPEYISRLQGSYKFPSAPQPGLAVIPAPRPDPAAQLALAQAALQLDEDPSTADGQLPGDEEANTTQGCYNIV